MPEIIAVVFDFDDTLAPDTTTAFLENWGINPELFWREKVDSLLQQGWDPIPAYLYQMIEESRARPPAERITADRLAAFGRQTRFHKGVNSIFVKLERAAREVYPEARLEFYVVSSGIREIIASTRISRHFKDIWASSFHCDPTSGEILFPRNIISFTDKTRYLFQISKGFVGPGFANRPFEVNRRIDPARLRVPFSRMIYVGDGYTDIPCFSLVRKNGGTAIGVYDPRRREKWSQAWSFIEEERVSNLVPADYSKNSALENTLIMAIEQKARTIALEQRTYRG